MRCFINKPKELTTRVKAKDLNKGVNHRMMLSYYHMFILIICKYTDILLKTEHMLNHISSFPLKALTDFKSELHCGGWGVFVCGSEFTKSKFRLN